jgi:hypothetical protein
MPQSPVDTTLFVSQLKAGAGITLTPSEGTGVVEVAATDGLYDPAAVDITGGTVDGVIIGGTTPEAGIFTGLEAVSLTGSTTPLSVVGAPAANATARGGEADLTGGVGGVTSGGGGPVKVTGGAAGIGSNGNGGDITLQGGAHDGTGVDGVVRENGIVLRQQGVPAAATVSATLSAANILAGIITVNQGGAAPSAQQLPLATDLDLALPSSVANDSFDFSVTNISVVAAEAASITTNTGWTLVGDMDVAANSAATTKSAGRFRARKTAAGAWSLYRLS